MTDLVSFVSSTPRFGLPNLFAGQMQKEFFVNEAHALADALLHCAVAGEGAEPPAFPEPGECWLIEADATGDWAGQEGKLASWQAETWLFVSPVPGMIVRDLSTGGAIVFDGAWQRLAAPAEPSGGSTIDHEARAALANLIETLQTAGLLPGN